MSPSFKPAAEEQLLHRRGAWLISENASWQMAGISGPLPSQREDRVWYRIETSGEELLLVSRRKEDRGMRRLRLEAITRISEAS